MEFHDYLEAGVKGSVRERTLAASWAKAKIRLIKSLRHLGDSRSQWHPTFAKASGFRGTEKALVENLVGYTMIDKVQLNATSGAFEKTCVPSEDTGKATDPALPTLLDGQAALIKSLSDKVMTWPWCGTAPKWVHECSITWSVRCLRNPSP